MAQVGAAAHPALQNIRRILGAATMQLDAHAHLHTIGELLYQAYALSMYTTLHASLGYRREHLVHKARNTLLFFVQGETQNLVRGCVYTVPVHCFGITADVSGLQRLCSRGATRLF